MRDVVISGVVVVCAAALLGLAVAGWRPVVLLSNSMSPGAPAGRATTTSPMPTLLARTDRVISNDPAGAARPVTHRVVRFTRDDTAAVTQGDANADADPTPVPLTGDLLVMRWAVPHAGRALMAVDRRNLLAAALILGSLVGLGRLWRPRSAVQR